MRVSYKKLWKLLIDKDLRKGQMRQKSGITTNSLAKLGKDENVSTEVLCKICKALDCSLEDIIEIIPEEEKQSHGER
jgi:putative transcriptional regulator|nr:helix-turn-helix domain-containing protein [uncultured Blautia sp.]